MSIVSRQIDRPARSVRSPRWVPSTFAATILGMASANALSQTAYFDAPTDTIRLIGETTLGSAYTIEALVYRTGGAPNDEGRIFAEQLDAQEDKWLVAGSTSTSGGSWNNQCDAARAGAGALSPGAWHHIALVRIGATYNFFVDGIRVDQRPATCVGSNAPGSRMHVGAYRYLIASTMHESFIGYIDWMRVSSVARYPVDGFTPPSAEPTLDASTLVLLTFNDAPGTIDPAVQGSGVTAATCGTGFTGATSPQFGAGPCDSIDFNSDGSSFDPTDIDAFLSVFSEGPCIPTTATCNDVDFNNDGSLFDPCDIDSFLLVFSEGPCTQCGV